MVTQTAESIPLDLLPNIPVVVQQHHGQISSDAGLLPLYEFDRKWGYTQRMVDCLVDPNPQRKQSLLSMLRQRFFGMLADYEDCNDHDTLRTDPIFKIVAGRSPEGEALASQPTLSRFENLITPAELQKLIDFTIATGIEHLKMKHGGRLPAVITLDLDATADATHGDQQLTFFHGFYEQFQYLPTIISEPTTKHVFIAWLRHGTAHASLGADDDLMRIVNALRAERPDIVIHVRGDAAFGVPRMYDVCEANNLFYTFGFSSNPRLKRMTEDLMLQAQKQFEETNEKARLFDCFQYKCNDWAFPRAVVAKVECHAGGTNRRFVVTNLPSECLITSRLHEMKFNETALVETEPAPTGTAPIAASVETDLGETSPVDAALVDTALVDTALVDTALVDTALVDTALVDTTRVDTALVDTARVNTAPVDAAHADAAHADAAHVDAAPADAAHVDAAPVDAAHVDAALVDTAPVDTTRVDTASIETATVEAVRAGNAPLKVPGITTAAQGEIVYDEYIQRGESEHRMDELKNGLHTDRLSCHRFMANFFRLLIHTAAYNFLNAVRDDSSLPDALRVGQPCTWRTHLIKVAAEVVQTTRRVIVRVAAQWPWWRLYKAVCARCAAFAPSAPGFQVAATALTPAVMPSS